MARLGGLPGGMGGLGDMKKLFQQAQKMQEDAAKLQEDLQKMMVTATSGGGMVTATVNGHGHLVAIKINPIVADADDVEMLEDLILTAAKEAQEKAQSDQQSRMDEITSGLGDLNLPPGFSL